MGRVAESTMAGLSVDLGEMTKAFPRAVVERILAESDRRSVRRRKLPAYMMVYYVIALGLMVSVSAREVLRRVVGGVCGPGGERAGMIASRGGSCKNRGGVGGE